MSEVFFSVRRAFQEQALTAAYGAALTIPIGARGATITLDDSGIAFVVQDQATGTPEEAVPAGSSWSLGNDLPLSETVSVKIKSAAGTPNMVLAYFLPVAVA